MSDETDQNVTKGEGYAVANLADLGEGPGFRKIRKELGVTAFGVNAIVLPPTYETGSHYHDEQEELYFVHSGEIEFDLRRRLDPASSAPAASPGSTPRPRAKCSNLSDSEEAVYVVVGGKDGYVGRDGKLAEGETHR